MRMNYRYRLRGNGGGRWVQRVRTQATRSSHCSAHTYGDTHTRVYVNNVDEYMYVYVCISHACIKHQVLVHSKCRVNRITNIITLNIPFPQKGCFGACHFQITKQEVETQGIPDLPKLTELVSGGVGWTSGTPDTGPGFGPLHWAPLARRTQRSQAKARGLGFDFVFTVHVLNRH